MNKNKNIRKDIHIESLPKNLYNFIFLSNPNDNILIKVYSLQLTTCEKFSPVEVIVENIDTGLYFTINKIEYRDQEYFENVIESTKSILQHKFKIENLSIKYYKNWEEINW